MRAEREQRDREREGAARRSRRLKLLGAVLVAAVAVVVVAIVASGGGDGSGSQSGPITGSAQVQARFMGIPQSDLVLGNPNAPVTFVEFADLKCPVCREYTLSAFPELVNRYVRTGKVKMELQLQHFVGNRDNDSERAARFALAAGKQNKLWNFADLFYLNQRDENDTYVNDVFLRRLGKGVPGLDVDQAFAARNGTDITNQLATASNEFNTAGFQGTPSFAVGKTGGTLTPIDYNSFDVSQFSGPIDKALGTSS
ncbi:MAG TPA: thioredoxin domain-containing protein [Thermoleophilaceae bacterium]